MLFHLTYYKGKMADPGKHKLVGLTQILKKTEEWFIQGAFTKKILRAGVEVSMVCEKNLHHKI